MWEKREGGVEGWQPLDWWRGDDDSRVLVDCMTYL